MASRRAAFLTPTNCSMQAQTLIRQRQSGFVLPFRVVICIDTKKYTGRAPNNIERRRRQSALICAFSYALMSFRSLLQSVSELFLRPAGRRPFFALAGC
jgi:hypothetical protein